MPAERYFIAHLPDENQAKVFLEGQEFHHFLHVMRNVKGDEVELIDGKGKLAQAQVESIEKKRAVLGITKLTLSPLPTPALILAQAIPRFNRLEFIIEKGTELGMTELWLFPGLQSEKKSFSENQLERMHTLIISAVKQCGRLYAPSIAIKPFLREWAKPHFPSFYGDLAPSAPPLIKIGKTHASDEGNIFFIGPESGFTDEEVSILQSLGAKGVKLNENILRTDTAAICALSLISQLIAKS